MKNTAKLIVLILILLISPALILWTINSLAEAGGSTFYIPHTPWNYWVAFVAAIVMNGGSK